MKWFSTSLKKQLTRDITNDIIGKKRYRYAKNETYRLIASRDDDNQKFPI